MSAPDFDSAVRQAEEFNSLVRPIRQSANLDEPAMADRLICSVETLRRIESGVLAPPSASYLTFVMAQVPETTFGYFLPDVDREDTPT